MPERKQTKVIAVTSGKGGVGKSNVSVNLAISLAKHGQSVILMDADLGMANIDIMLGIKPRYDLYNVVTGTCALEDAMIEGPMGIKIVPASSGIGHMANLSLVEQAGLIRAFDELNDMVDVLIVDTAAGISSSVVSFTKAAHEIVVVLCDEPAAITDAYALMKVLSVEHRVNRFHVLSNMVRDSEQGKNVYCRLMRVADMYLNISIKYLGCIPLDPILRQAVSMQSAVVESFPFSASGIAFQKLAERVLDMPETQPTTGFLEFFVEQNIRNNVNMAGRVDG